MVVKCLKCGSPEVILAGKFYIDFKFDKNGNVVLCTDVADEIYWAAEYEKSQVVCQCKMCGSIFDYDDWKKSKGVENYG